MECYYDRDRGDRCCACSNGVIKFFEGLPKTMRGKSEGLVPRISNSLMVESDGLI